MDEYIGIESAGQVVNRVEIVDGDLLCYHDKLLLQTVTNYTAHPPELPPTERKRQPT